MAFFKQFREVDVAFFVFGIDGIVIFDVIAVVIRGRMARREPNAPDAKALEVIEVIDDALEVANAIAIAVGLFVFETIEHPASEPASEAKPGKPELRLVEPPAAEETETTAEIKEKAE